MITGIGLDIVELDRIERMAQEHSQFIDRILTPHEKELLDSRHNERVKLSFIAGRFAAKEAFSKAYGSGIGKDISFQDIVVGNDEKGKPYIIKSPHMGSTYISITHTDTIAAAQVILEK